jgi:hypothetical protein
MADDKADIMPKFEKTIDYGAEIAALKAENYELKRVIEALPTCQMVEDLEAERDELKASLSHERAKFYNERDRLRAALEKIIKSEWLGSADTKMLAIARRELEKDQER